MGSERRAGAATWTEVASVLGASTALTAWWLWPLPVVWRTHAARFGSDFPPALADYYLIVWIMSWDTHALFTAPWRLFHANILYPSTLSLAYSDHLVGYVPLFAPFYALTGNPIFGMNAVIFATYPLCALAMYCLARRWTGRPAAAVAAFFYAFCLWRYNLPGAGIHILGVQYLPLTVLFSERWFESGHTRDAALLGVVLVLQALSSMYLAYGVGAVYGTYLLTASWRWRRQLDRRRLMGLVLVGSTASAAVVAVSIPYLLLRQHGLIQSYGGHNMPIGLVPFIASRPVFQYLQEQGLGRVGYALAAIALLPPWPRGRRWPLVVALLIALVGTLGSFGPGIFVAGHTYWSPYALLFEWVPGLSNIRLPSRFLAIAHAGFALLAGLGVARLLDGARAWLAWPAAVGIMTAALWTYGPFPVLPLMAEPTGSAVPPAYRWLGDHGEGRVLLELPGANLAGSARKMYFSTYHWLPIIDGYGGYAPATATHVHWIARGLPAAAALQELVDWADIGWILVHRDLLQPGDREMWALPLPPGLERVAAWGDDILLRVTLPVRDDRRARLLSETETLGGVPLAPLGDTCPGVLRVADPPPNPWRPLTEARVTVDLENTGTVAWPATGFYPRHLVQVQGTLIDPDGVEVAGTVQSLMVDVPPGGKERSILVLKAPLRGWDYALKIELIQLMDGSLARCGVAPLRIPVRVG